MPGQVGQTRSAARADRMDIFPTITADAARTAEQERARRMDRPALDVIRFARAAAQRELIEALMQATPGRN